MRIVLIGPGIMPIPPNGWGAVETLIWDYSIFLKERGHSVDIVNTPDREEIVRTVNQGHYDVAHVHYDVFVDIVPRLTSKRVCITSHFPYIDRPQLWGGYRDTFFKICDVVRSGAFYYSISEKDLNAFLRFGAMGQNAHRLFLMKNGVHTDAFRFADVPLNPDRSLTLGKIENRKRQFLTYSIDSVDYMGRGPCDHPNYKGEPRDCRPLLTEYANLVLLSDGENGTPLVVKEAMAAGLGLVLSEAAANELPRDLAWITVIPECDLGNVQKVTELIAENRKVSLSMRSQIREWVRVHWDWGILVDQYMKNLQSMRIVLIGPGAMSIPPHGWGACESLIWDYAQTFRSMGHKVLIVNTLNADEIVRQTNEFSPDIVHLQYDEHYAAMNRITCRAKVATSHYAYLEHQSFNGNWGYRNIFNGYMNGPFVIAALSEGIKQVYVRAGCLENKIYVAPNGANDRAFRYTDAPLHFDRSIYVGKIEERKKQYVYQTIPSLYFAGNTICSKFNTASPRYLGEWSKQVLYDSLTEYGNLVLLSDGEAHPLVVCEALMCGLGVVVSRVASANLDLSKSWITVIPDEKLGDVEYVTKAIEENRAVAVASRKEIREYALKNFTWSVRAQHLYQLYRMMTGL